MHLLNEQERLAYEIIQWIKKPEENPVMESLLYELTLFSITDRNLTRKKLEGMRTEDRKRKGMWKIMCCIFSGNKTSAKVSAI